MTPKRHGIKTLSVLLAVLLFITSIPLTVFAATLADPVSAPSVSEGGESESSPVLSGILPEAVEDTSLREESIKHFRLSDGSYTAFQYPTAVHLQDADGKWQDIDNRLTAGASEYASSDARIKFVKKITGNGAIFTLHEGNHKLTTSLDGAIKKTVGEAINAETEFDESATLLQKLTTLDHLSTRVIYRDILKDIDLEYLVTGRNIKENLIVKTKDAGNSFSFTLKLNNMTATLTEDGAVVLRDGDAVCYTVPAPTVWDDGGTYAEAGDAYYTLEDLGNGSYRLFVTVSETWMTADDRTYPVTIDPPIIYPSTNTNAVDTYISSANASATYGSSSYNWVSSTQHTYWALNNMTPPIPYNATIINATYIANYWVNESTTGHIGVYRVTQDWNYMGLTWNVVHSDGTSGSIASRCFDFVKISHPYGGGSNVLDTISFDITEIVKDWQSNPSSNFGICLKPVTSLPFTGAARIVSCENTDAANRPYLAIQYRIANGVESYWSTVSQSAGSAGSGSVNLNQGYLTFAFNGLTTREAIYPYTPSLVYNSAQAGYYCTVGYGQASSGHGWLITAQQAIVPKTTNTNVLYYVWLDGDGTEHAFLPYQREGSGIIEYYDEDGLGIRLTVSSSSTSSYKYALTTPYSVYYYFDQGGHLVREEDAWGNARRYARNTDGQVTEVYVHPSDSSSEYKQVTYTYNTTTKLLSSIRYVATGHQFLFYYGEGAETPSLSGSGDLRKIELYTSASDTGALPYLTVEYEYDSFGCLTSAIDTFNQSKVTYTWDDFRITGITEYYRSSGDWEQGQSMSLSYQPSGKNETAVRSAGTDDILNTSDDLVTHYVFDAYCRTTTCYVTDVGGSTVYGTTDATYVNTQESGSFLQENRISAQASVGKAGTNYFANGTLDASLDYWTFTSATGTAYKNSDRDYAVKLKYSASTTTPSGMYQSVKLTPGTYTFSADIRMVSTSGNTTVKLNVTNSSGLASVTSSNTLTNNSMTNTNAKYVPLSVTFTVSTTTTYRFYVDISATTSSATTYCYVDNLNLTQGVGIDGVSFINDGGFEAHSGSTYTYWTNQGSGTAYSQYFRMDGANGLRINGIANAKAYTHQTITLLGDRAIQAIQENATEYTGKSSGFVLSGYGKATSRSQITTSAESGINGTESTFALAAKVWYMQSDGTTDESDLFLFSFDPHTTDWQFVSGMITFDAAKGHPYQIEVFCSYNYNLGTAYFDSIVLTEAANSQSYTYDDNGFVISSIDGASGIETVYGRNGVDVLYETRSDGVTINRDYQNHKVTAEWTTVSGEWIETVQNSYDYDECGLLVFSDSLASYEEGSYDLAYAQTEYTYSKTPATYGQPLTVTSPTGVTRYFYYQTIGTSNALLYAVIGEDGNGTAYTYDDLGRQLTSRPATYSGGMAHTVTDEEHANFAYDGGNLVSVDTDSTNYHFAYNTFSARDSVSVGAQKIVRYLYNAYNGKLCYVVYGNGYIEKMVYDELDRIKSIWYYEGGNITASESTIKGYSYTNQAVEYVYNGAGDVSEYIDYIANKRYVYSYDVAGRVESVCCYYLNGNAIVLTDKISATYDSESRLSAMNYAFKFGGSNYSYSGTYTYDVLGRVTAYNENSFISTYTYLPIGFVGSQKTTYGSATVETVYGYEESPRSSVGLYELTGRVANATVTVKYGSTQKSQNDYTFTYDAAGNITAIRVGGALKYSYEYDNLNQLTRENNAVANKTYVYTYDDAGNILTKKTYAYTTGTLGTVQSTNTYTYGNANWGDQLTKFNGTSITYDSLGNPLSYYNGNSYTFTWAKGRQLTSTIKGGVTTSYTYNADGIRIGKNVGGTAVEYMLDGSQILAEKNGSTVLRYFYDANSSPVGMMIGSTYYLYEKNLQGDIVGIYTTSGLKVASYTYDAWGNTVSSSYTSGYQTAHDLNPFRYRGYYYDTESGFYYLQSRYYDPTTGRFISADNQLSIVDMTGMNLYAYCGNNPVNRIDPTGEAWWHWAIGAAIVVACAVAVVVTAGGATAGVAAVAAVANGTAAATTASTVAAGAFIGSATALGSAALVAATNSDSLEEFSDKGNWGTVAGIAGGAVLGGVYGYTLARSQNDDLSYNLNGSKDEKYLNKRGWNDEKIRRALNNGKQGISINMSNKEPCTVYRYPNTSNQYIVIENCSRSIVQASNLNDPNWIPDCRIIWFS